jgi:hypothetical protein
MTGTAMSAESAEAPAAQPSTTPRWSRRRKASVLTAGVACAVVALAILIGIAPPGFTMLGVSVCRLGAEVGSYVIWTPTLLLDKPDATNVSVWTIGGDWNYTFRSGSLTVGFLPPGPFKYGSGESDGGGEGGLFGNFQNHNWTFYRPVNESVIGTSPSPCTQRYVAKIGNPLGCGGSVTLPLLPNNSTDTNEPHTWNGTVGENGSEPVCTVQTPGTSVWFDSSFHSGGAGASAPVNLNLCDSPSNFPLELLGVARIPIVVSVPDQGREISATGFLTWQGNPMGTFIPGIGSEASATWNIPGGWNWTLAPVGPASFPINPSQPLPALVAFERNSC